MAFLEFLKRLYDMESEYLGPEGAGHGPMPPMGGMEPDMDEGGAPMAGGGLTEMLAKMLGDTESTQRR